MLFVTVLTFIGLPATQSFSAFSENNFSEKVSLDFAEEEESENSQEETKEPESKLVHKHNDYSALQLNRLNETGFLDCNSWYRFIIREVSTPPPEGLTT